MVGLHPLDPFHQMGIPSKEQLVIIRVGVGTLRDPLEAPPVHLPGKGRVLSLREVHPEDPLAELLLAQDLPRPAMRQPGYHVGEALVGEEPVEHGGKVVPPAGGGGGRRRPSRTRPRGWSALLGFFPPRRSLGRRERQRLFLLLLLLVLLCGVVVPSPAVLEGQGGHQALGPLPQALALLLRLLLLTPQPLQGVAVPLDLRPVWPEGREVPVGVVDPLDDVLLAPLPPPPPLPAPFPGGLPAGGGRPATPLRWYASWVG